MSGDTQAVPRHFNEAVLAGDLDRAMDGYAEYSGFASNIDSVLKDRDAIRSMSATDVVLSRAAARPERVQYLLHALSVAETVIDLGLATGRVRLRPAAADEFNVQLAFGASRAGT